MMCFQTQFRLVKEHPADSSSRKYFTDKKIVRMQCSERSTKHNRQNPGFQQLCNPKNYQGYGGAYRDRTDDIQLAKLALSQLS